MLSRVKRRKDTTDTLVGIDVQTDGVALAFSRAAPRGGGRRLTCEFVPFSGGGSAAAAIAGAVDRHGLKRCPAVYLMPPAQYSLLQAAIPPMSREEMRAAARWKIGELIDYPVDRAVVDVFEVPESGQRGTERLLYVVAARADDVRGHVEEMRRAGVELQAIDIGELALRNVVARLPENDQGAAVLCLGEHSGSLVVIKQDELYLSRRLEIGFDDLMSGGEAVYDEVVLELQRSLDYFESRFTQALPARLLIFPPEKFSAELTGHIASRLDLEVEPLILEKLPGHQIEADGQGQVRCLWAAGAALSERPEAPAR